MNTISQKMENDAFQIKFQTGIRRNHRQNVIKYYLLRQVDCRRCLPIVVARYFMRKSRLVLLVDKF